MSKKLFVGNLPFSATKESLEHLFSQYGAVEDSKIIQDPQTKRSKGFGFVTMTDDAQALEAVQKLNGTEFDGRALTVAEAKPQEPRENRPRPPRGGGRGGFGGGGREGGGGGGRGGFGGGKRDRDGGRGFGGGGGRDGGGRGGSY